MRRRPNPGTGAGNVLSRFELWQRFDGIYFDRGGILMLIDLVNRGATCGRISQHFGFTRQYADQSIRRLGLYLPIPDRGVPPARLIREDGLSLLLSEDF